MPLLGPVLIRGDRAGKLDPDCADREVCELATSLAIAVCSRFTIPTPHHDSGVPTHDLAFPAPPAVQPSPGILPQEPHRLAKQHRRMATLETLESRVVLSNVTTSLAGNVLTITGDKFNNSFKIAEVRSL